MIDGKLEEAVFRQQGMLFFFYFIQKLFHVVLLLIGGKIQEMISMGSYRNEKQNDLSAL